MKDLHRILVKCNLENTDNEKYISRNVIAQQEKAKKQTKTTKNIGNTKFKERYIKFKKIFL